MKDIKMTYKGYVGSIRYNEKDQIFYGKLEFINALVSYEGRDITSLRRSFRKAVSDYLKSCQQTNRQPEKPMLTDPQRKEKISRVTKMIGKAKIREDALAELEKMREEPDKN
jgi:hypothetical protein